jgi:phosphoglucosamine mutase
MVSYITRTQNGFRSGSTSESEVLTKGIEDSFAHNLIALPANPLFGTDGIRSKVENC